MWRLWTGQWVLRSHFHPGIFISSFFNCCYILLQQFRACLCLKMVLPSVLTSCIIASFNFTLSHRGAQHINILHHKFWDVYMKRFWLFVTWWCSMVQLQVRCTGGCCSVDLDLRLFVLSGSASCSASLSHTPLSRSDPLTSTARHRFYSLFPPFWFYLYQ